MDELPDRHDAHAAAWRLLGALICAASAVGVVWALLALAGAAA